MLTKFMIASLAIAGFTNGKVYHRDDSKVICRGERDDPCNELKRDGDWRCEYVDMGTMYYWCNKDYCGN